MISKSSILTIQEYMTGIVVKAATADSDTMDVHIPSIMPDKTASASKRVIVIPSTLMVSKENISTASSVSDLSYITIKVSDSFKRTNREITAITISGTPVYEYDKLPVGSSVKVYCPNNDLDKAMVIPT